MESPGGTACTNCFDYYFGEYADGQPESCGSREFANWQAASQFAIVANRRLNARKRQSNDQVFTFDNLTTLTNPNGTAPISEVVHSVYRTDQYPTGAPTRRTPVGDFYDNRGQFATYGLDVEDCLFVDKARRYGDDTYQIIGLSQANAIHGDPNNPPVSIGICEYDYSPAPSSVQYVPQGSHFDPNAPDPYWDTYINVGKVGIYHNATPGIGGDCL